MGTSSWLTTSWMRQVRCLWWWTSVSTMNVFGSNSDPSLNGHLHYPNDIDRSINEDTTDKIRKYHTDYNNNPPNITSFMSDFPSMSARLHSEFVCLLFLQDHRETDRLFTTSGVHGTVDCSTSAARCCPHNSSLKWVAPSPRLQIYM